MHISFWLIHEKQKCSLIKKNKDVKAILENLKKINIHIIHTAIMLPKEYKQIVISKEIEIIEANDFARDQS